MIITIIGLFIIASVPLTGGSLSRMADLAFRHTWLVLLSLGVQIGITVIFTGADAALLAALHIGSYLLAVAFLWINRRVPGLAVLGAGGMANFAAIGANGGVMPASPSALAMAGMAHDGGFENSTAVEGARLQFLGDIFAIPEGWPFANVFSIGDLILLAGVAILVHSVGRWPASSVEQPPMTDTGVEPDEAAAVPTS